MNLSELAGARDQELFWVLAAAAAAPRAFRRAQPAERRARRIAGGLLALAVGAPALVGLWPQGAALA